MELNLFQSGNSIAADSSDYIQFGESIAELCRDRQINPEQVLQFKDENFDGMYEFFLHCVIGEFHKAGDFSILPSMLDDQDLIKNLMIDTVKNYALFNRRAGQNKMQKSTGGYDALNSLKIEEIINHPLLGDTYDKQSRTDISKKIKNAFKTVTQQAEDGKTDPFALSKMYRENVINPLLVLTNVIYTNSVKRKAYERYCAFKKNPDLLENLDFSRSNEYLDQLRLAASSDRPQLLYQAAKACPVNMNVYVTAAEFGLLDDQTISFLQHFGLSKDAVKAFGSTLVEYPAFREFKAKNAEMLNLMAEIDRYETKDVIRDFAEKYRKDLYQKDSMLMNFESVLRHEIGQDYCQKETDVLADDPITNLKNKVDPGSPLKTVEEPTIDFTNPEKLTKTSIDTEFNRCYDCFMIYDEDIDELGSILNKDVHVQKKAERFKRMEKEFFDYLEKYELRRNQQLYREALKLKRSYKESLVVGTVFFLGLVAYIAYVLNGDYNDMITNLLWILFGFVLFIIAISFVQKGLSKRKAYHTRIKSTTSKFSVEELMTDCHYPLEPYPRRAQKSK